MTPVWVFPAYPLLLIAPFAANLLQGSIATGDPGINGHPIHRVAIASCALTIQGTGFLISYMVCAAFLYRLMTQKLPRDMQRPGVVSRHPTPSLRGIGPREFSPLTVGP